MRTRLLAITAVLGVLVIGAALGAAGRGHLARSRQADYSELLKRQGLANHLEEILELREDQRLEVRRAIRSRTQNINLIRVEAFLEVRDEIDALENDLEPLLDSAQVERFREMRREVRSDVGSRLRELRSED